MDDSLLAQESKKSGTAPQPETVQHGSKKPLRFQSIGVWSIMREAKTPWSVPGLPSWSRGKDLLEILPFIYRFLCECLSVGPWLVTIYVLSSLWSSTEPAVGLYFSSRILDIIQHGIVERHVRRRALVTAVASRVGFTLCDCVIGRTRRRIRTILATRVRYLFEARLIQANLRLDLPTFEEPETASKINRLLGRGRGGVAWAIFNALLDKLRCVVSVLSQLSLLFGILRSQPGGFWFAILCVAKSLLDHITYQSIWSETCYVWASDARYRRLSCLVDMVVDVSHRMEILSDVLTNYIKREWTKARSQLGDLSDDHPSNVLRLHKPLWLSFLSAGSDDFPLVFYAFQVLRSPESFSLTSVALMQQASSSLTYTISSIIDDQESLEERFSEIRSIYSTGIIETKVQDGKLAYPQDCAKPSLGMEITFENVSFGYPRAENVIKDVSFTIRRGQTVVIVGVNGSGKSTLLKLFNRLYDPNAGTVFVDGVPMKSFNTSDLRRSSAILFQKYSHFPMSIRENISIGQPDMEPSPPPPRNEKGHGAHEELVREAARLGGSIEFVEEQADGFSTVLQPHVRGWSTTSKTPSDAFKEKMKEINKRADVSLGQWQRLALSRLFFRAAGKGIKLVAVDEPSAALDPKMEYELFERLRELSTTQGKTMVFVTHRFGYLTKRADLILVMHNGSLVEKGKHNELLKMGGEYAKLYNLQAEAFLPSEDPK